ncbi:MAG TPA: dipeptidase PepV [Bacillota bacterium]|nr:dipeptidase PepV [Bacillota bacterium]HQE02637.1 dipeptidase PepV [Bacillota bacterium]
MDIRDYKDKIVETAQELIKIPSVKEADQGPGKPFGAPIAQALEFMLAKGRELGFKTENFSGYAGHIEYGQGPEILGILCHLDVVPAGEGWSVPPFSGEIRDGRIYGRGAIDNKGPAVAVLYALAALRDSGWQPKRRIRLILGTDEESGWGCMEHYMQAAEKPHLGFAPDAEFPVIYSEKGILMVELAGKLVSPQGIVLTALDGGNRPNMVPDRCRVGLQGVREEEIAAVAAKIGAKIEIDKDETGQGLHLLFKGVSAHGSMPETGENAISYALAMLYNLGFTEGIIGFLYRQIGFSHDGRGLNIEVKDEVSGPLTANMGVISMEEDTVKVLLDIRYPVSFREEQILEKMGQVLPASVQLTPRGGKGPLFVDPGSPLIRVLQQVYRKHTGEEPRLISIGGGTYARALDNGVAFGPVFPGQEELAHQKDEYISIEHLLKLAEIYGDAIRILGEEGGVLDD